MNNKSLFASVLTLTVLGYASSACALLLPVPTIELPPPDVQPVAAFELVSPMLTPVAVKELPAIAALELPAPGETPDTLPQTYSLLANTRSAPVAEPVSQQNVVTTDNSPEPPETHSAQSAVPSSTEEYNPAVY